MHDTALEIGKAAIDIYTNGKATILELGSLDVNGSLRQFAPDGSSYVGVDLVPGESVDVVVKAGEPLPFEDQVFDLILASSVFEHDPAFWQTFLDLSRLLRDGGHLYINAPSNGMVHRFPEDHWRFYPDSSLALERWAASQGVSMKLIESFTAPRKGDIWNDFVAVYRKGDGDGKLNGRFLHSEFNGKNVWIKGNSEPIKESAATQDMELILAERRKVEAIESKITDVRAEAHAASQKIRTLDESLKRAREELENEKTDREAAEAAANRKSEEAADKINLLQAEIEQMLATIASLESDLHESTAEAGVQRRNVKAARAENTKLKGSLSMAEHRLEKVEASVKERFDEIVSLTRLLTHAEKERRKAVMQQEWLADVLAVSSSCPAWWSLLPPAMRRTKRFNRLKLAGVFDAVGYLKLYPDVASSGMDPVRHYVLHGMKEGRTLTQ